jgi:hypothetical protein
MASMGLMTIGALLSLPTGLFDKEVPENYPIRLSLGRGLPGV